MLNESLRNNGGVSITNFKYTISIFERNIVARKYELITSPKNGLSYKLLGEMVFDKDRYESYTVTRLIELYEEGAKLQNKQLALLDN